MRVRAVALAMVPLLLASVPAGADARTESRYFLGSADALGTAVCALHDEVPTGMDVGGACFRIRGGDTQVRVTVYDDDRTRYAGGQWAYCFKDGGCLAPRVFCHTFTIEDVSPYRAHFIKVSVARTPPCTGTSPLSGVAFAEFS